MTRFHKRLLLLFNLLNEISAHRTDSTDEQIQHFVLAKEERIVKNVQRLAQKFAIHHKRDVSFGSTLRTSYHTDSTPAQSAEKFARNAGSVLHVFANNGNSGQTTFHLHREHRTRLYFFGELFVKYVHNLFCIGV